VGGCLTAFGNPPIFLGVVMGIPPWWVLRHCWPMWSVGVMFLLTVFYLVDRRQFRGVPSPVFLSGRGGVDGRPNLFFLAVILAAVFIKRPAFLSEGLMLGAALASWFSTKKTVHEANQFDFQPIREVGILFLGIFATIMPALDWLQARAPILLGDQPSPGVMFWGSGILSSFLDNAPTYLSFLAALFGTQGQALGHPVEMAGLLSQATLSRDLAALSIGAVFFGGCTYIGNAPNLMVKAIAEKQGVPLPGFLGYIFKWAVPVMLPLLTMIWMIFFH
jgi:Na+/H+ antiporter NhaD/arsenite permease-like protein